MSNEQCAMRNALSKYSEAVNYRSSSLLTPHRPLLIAHCSSQSFVHSAVDQHRLSRDVRCALGCQPDDCIGEFARIAEAFQRGIGGPTIEEILLGLSGCGRPRLRQFFQTIRGSKTWAYIVDQDSVFAEFVCQALHQTDYSRANRIRKDEIGHRLLGRDGSDGDEPSPFLALHERDHFAGEIDIAQEVGVD